MASKLKFRKGETTHVVKTKKGGAKIYKDKKCKTELCFGTDQKAKRVRDRTPLAGPACACVRACVCVRPQERCGAHGQVSVRVRAGTVHARAAH